MGVTPEQREAIKADWQTYMQTGHGRDTLYKLLVLLGTFQDADVLYEAALDRPQLMMGVIEGLMVLKNLGILLGDNRRRLIDLMAQLPMPEIELQGDGEYGKRA